MGHLTSFQQALDGLGATNKERARALGISETVFYGIKRGEIPNYIKRLVRQPSLLEALLDDARAGRSNGNHHDEEQTS